MNTIGEVLGAGGATIVVLVAKATIVLAMVWLASLVLRHATAASRHLVWLAGVAGLLLLPLLSRAAFVRVPILPSATRVMDAPVSGKAISSDVTSPSTGSADDRPKSGGSMIPIPDVEAPPASVTSPVAGPTSLSWRGQLRAELAGVLSHPAGLLLGLWLTIGLGVVVWLMTGVFAVRRILRASRSLTSADWLTPLRELADRMDLSDVPRLVISDDVELAFLCNLRHPTVVLPASAEEWGDDLRRTVLLHELAHVRRRDLVGHALGRLACAVYWFHPLAWSAARQLRAESERACDDIVLSCGARPSDYAQQLLTMVTNARHDGAPMGALAMARRKEIEGRMLAILDPALPRLAIGRARSFALLASLALLVLSVAAMEPSQRAPTTKSEAATAPAVVAASSVTAAIPSNTVSPMPAVHAPARITPVDSSALASAPSSALSVAPDAPVRDRTLGAPTAVGEEPFTDIAAVRELSDGRLVVAQTGPPSAAMLAIIAQYDFSGSLRGRGEAPNPNGVAKVVLLDAKLKNPIRVGQSGSEANQYQNPATLVTALHDSTLIGEQLSGGVLVVDPKGLVIGRRTLAALGPSAQLELSTAATDPAGRMIYQAPNGQIAQVEPDGMHISTPDSAAITALDLRTGVSTPIAYVRTAGSAATMVGAAGQPGTSMHSKEIPFPLLDDWVMLPDGSIAVVRGADMHIDWIAPNGKRRSTPPLPFVRIPVTDADTARYLKGKRRQNADTMLKKAMGALMSGGMTADLPDSFPAFKPPFSERGAKAASDGTIWLPSHILSPSAPQGYDVIDHNGHLIERVHLPTGQSLLGFGKGVVYVSLRDSSGAVRVGRVPLH